MNNAKKGLESIDFKTLGLGLALGGVLLAFFVGLALATGLRSGVYLTPPGGIEYHAPADEHAASPSHGHD